ncbi:hypothetical protein V500_09458 [Pseudogymnoascus sp. VKM F-4518 (FW-2643)]|nr:hypothetical protein V500_09458 [Pseudogymnoascus sp. VKM F-4518 (FW-2643)]
MATFKSERPPLASLCSADELTNRKFDYIIVGGGTAGLVLANRLTDDPTIHVAVIEAGSANIDDPNLLTPALFSTVISNEKYDWMMETAPQVGHNGKVHQFPRGKSLGGSTAINFMMYGRGQKEEYDNWERLGNPGWAWEDMLPYFRKAQHLDEPKTFNIPTKLAYVQSNHGREGPIHTSFASYRIPAENDWLDSATDTATKADIPRSKDAFGGNHLGFFNSLETIDRVDKVGTRSYATTGYFLPAAQRPNLKVLTEALVTKLVLEESEGTVVARGVELSMDGGKTRHIVNATREVIICAGVIKTPQLLELSGIGNPNVLRRAGVTTIVSSPAVGENLQDHIVTGITYELDAEDFSMDRLQNTEDMQAALAEYNTKGDGPFTVTIGGMGFMPYARLVSPGELRKVVSQAEMVDQTGKSKYAKNRREMEIKLLGEKNTASLQLMFLPANGDCTRGDDQHKFLGPAPLGKVHVAQGVALQFPLSHGSVHIRTNSALDQPEIDPSYLSDPSDVALLVKGLQFADRVSNAEPFAGRLRNRVCPTADVDLQDDAACEIYLRDASLTQYHPIGTAAMGEVVDAHLCVYGVKGLRVVDASVMPMHVSGNIVSTVYAIAEKAADMIKAENA